MLPRYRRMFEAGMVMLLATQIVIMVEGLCRWRFMVDRYESLWGTMTHVFRFSEGWWAYVTTGHGCVLTLMIGLWMLAAALLIAIPMVKDKAGQQPGTFRES